MRSIIGNIYKDKNYTNLDELKNAISAECNKISIYQLANVRREFYDRLDYSLATNGGIFEHFLNLKFISNILFVIL